MRKTEEESMRTILVAVVGFAVLMAFVPAWARFEVTAFAVAFAALAYALDENVRGAIRRVLDSGLRRDDSRKARAKSPAGHRAGT